MHRLVAPVAIAAFAAFFAAARPAIAQEEPEPLGDDGAIPASVHPGSDSPDVTKPKRTVAANRKRAQAFLIPLDERSRAATARVAQAVEGVLAGTAHYEVIDLGKALSVDFSPEQAGKAEEGRRLVAEANAAFDGHGYGDAEAKYKAAIKALEKGLAAVAQRDYAEAWLRLAATAHLAGDEKTAGEAFAAVARLDPQQKLQPRLVDESAEQPLQGARADAEAAANGVVEVETRPAGARVLVDGEAHGIAPARLEVLAGKHVVRVERPGYFPHAELVDVAPGAKKSATVTATLASTPIAANLNQVIAGAADEVSRGQTGKNTTELAEKFALERVVIGSVSTHDRRISVLVAVVDARKQKLVGKSSLLLIADGTDSDQVENETQAATRRLVALDVPAPDETVAAGIKPAESSAPETGSSSRRAVMPGSQPQAAAPSDDDAPLVTRERKVAAPSSGALDKPPPEPSSDKPAPDSTEQVKKKQGRKAPKGLTGKSGTEHWGTDE